VAVNAFASHELLPVNGTWAECALSRDPAPNPRDTSKSDGDLLPTLVFAPSAFTHDNILAPRVLQLFSTKYFRAHLRAFWTLFARISVFMDAFARCFAHQLAVFVGHLPRAQRKRDTPPNPFAAVTLRIASP
jgi:hypothetical protein